MRALLLLAALAAAASSCTMLTSFDAEGQPCDVSAIRPEEQCLNGFHCEMGKCKRGAYDGGK